MGFRLSFGIGPLRYSTRLGGKRRRSARPRAPSYTASLRLENGASWECEHNHRSRQSAVDCTQRATRKLAAGQPLVGLKMPKDRCWSCGDRRKNHSFDGLCPRDPVVTWPYPVM